MLFFGFAVFPVFKLFPLHEQQVCVACFIVVTQQILGRKLFCADVYFGHPSANDFTGSSRSDSLS